MPSKCRKRNINGALVTASPSTLSLLLLAREHHHQRINGTFTFLSSLFAPVCIIGLVTRILRFLKSYQAAMVLHHFNMAMCGAVMAFAFLAHISLLKYATINII